MQTPGRRTLETVDLDSGALAEITPDLGPVNVAGPDSWSADCRWIYFDAGPPTGPHRIYRVDVSRRVTEPLTPATLSAGAPALSPDGGQIAFVVRDHTWYDLYAADSDGTSLHLVLPHAVNDGWSADGQSILAEWMPPREEGTGALVTLRPDGTGRVMVFPFAADCTRPEGGSCVQGVTWGQPRP